MAEGENPTRRYKSFRPRQAARSAYIPGTPTNFATHSLYNNSSGPHVLVVRSISGLPSTGQPLRIAYVAGTLGANLGTVTPFFPGGAAPAGQHFYLDDAAQITADYVTSNPINVLIHAQNFPIGILPPQWSLAVQTGNSGNATYIGFIWEVVGIDELDYLDW